MILNKIADFESRKRLIYVLKICCAAVFFARAYQHLFYDAPYRTLLWDEGWLKSIVETIFSVEWNDYATSPVVDTSIRYLTLTFGILYITCGIAAICINENRKSLGNLLLLGTGLLCFLSFLYTKEKFFHFGQFFEYSAQFTAPTILYFLLFRFNTNNPKVITFLKLTIALTFVCHGLYAIGYYPRPGHFVDMTINSLGISESSAHTFLFFAGVFDFIVAVTLFIPTLSIPSAYYMLIWGFATSLARLVANIQYSFFFETFSRWWFEFAYRIPHFLFPLLIIISIQYLKRKRPDSLSRLAS